ncbi:MAG: UDP-N-acetylglucosamine 2-epimerase (non-hydrolyzing) [Pseudomonadota bacterium]
MKILSIVGARPQFMKLAPFARALIAGGHEHKILHTGQHYDHGMSDVFFEELQIPKPDINLDVGSGHHGEQTGQMLVGIEKILQKESFDWVVVYGDTNSTVAGALAAAKLHVPIGHIEAGLRSFNREMPEEINRIATDHISDLLLAPTQTAMGHLRREGLSERSEFTGDIMLDTVLFNRKLSENSAVLTDMNLDGNEEFALVTIHRAENTDDSERLRKILSAIEKVSKETQVVFPVHPRAKKAIQSVEPGFGHRGNIRVVEPVGYLDMLRLASSAQLILTDSGGLQKEAYFLGVPCVTMRDETEWSETLEAHANLLAGAETDAIVAAAAKMQNVEVVYQAKHFGEGEAAQVILDCLSARHERSAL